MISIRFYDLLLLYFVGVKTGYLAFRLYLDRSLLVYCSLVNMDIDIIDSHLHVYDLALRSQFPNQNWSHTFPSKENETDIVYDVPQTLAKSVANQSGVSKVVFVMCFDDCPEEAQWVYDNAQNTDLIVGIVAGLDLTKHEKLRTYIEKFRKEFKAPKFVGIRHHICFNEDLLFR